MKQNKRIVFTQFMYNSPAAATPSYGRELDALASARDLVFGCPSPFPCVSSDKSCRRPPPIPGRCERGSGGYSSVAVPDSGGRESGVAHFCQKSVDNKYHFYPHFSMNMTWYFRSRLFPRLDIGLPIFFQVWTFFEFFINVY